MANLLEYIWLDGYHPTQNMRSKTKIIDDFSNLNCHYGLLMEVRLSKQRNSSDCLLKPVACYPDPIRENGFLVMTEVLNAGTPMNPMPERK